MKACVVTLAILLIGAFSASAQVKVDTIDAGERDSVVLDLVSLEISDEQIATVIIEVSCWSDIGIMAGLSVGFSWHSETGAILDSATATELSKSSFDFGQWLYRNNTLDSTNHYRQFQFFGVRRTTGLVPTRQFQPLARYYFTIRNWSTLSSLKIDTQTFSLGSILVASTYTSDSTLTYHKYAPIWSGPLVIHDPNRPCCVNIMGNIDGADGIDIGDQTLLIDHLFGSGAALSCRDAANVDGSEDGSIDMADLVILTEFLFAGGELAECK